jgi:hypothetical protein
MLASHVDALGIWNLELRGGMEMPAVQAGSKSTSRLEIPVHRKPARWLKSCLLIRACEWVRPAHCRGLAVAVAVAMAEAVAVALVHD